MKETTLFGVFVSNNLKADFSLSSSWNKVNFVGFDKNSKFVMKKLVLELGSGISILYEICGWISCN